MDGFSGFNPEQARRDLDSFYEAWLAISKYTREQYYAYYKALHSNWFSPGAVEASNWVIEWPSFLKGHINMIINDIFNPTVSAVKTVAKYHGYDFVYDVRYLDRTMFTPHDPLSEAGPNGEVGMNMVNVNIALSEFTKGVNNIITAVNNLPTNIALYDPTGQLQQIFKDRIRYITDKLTSDVEEATIEINERVKTEINNNRIGVNNATQALAG